MINQLKMAKAYSLLVFIVLMQRGSPSIHQAGHCLKEFENNILHSTHVQIWMTRRHDFISSIDQTRNATDIDVLFEQLNSVELSLMSRKLTNSWTRWKRRYWKVMMDPDLDSRKTITRFIIVLKFLECNLLPGSLNYHWIDHRRRKWLSKCNALVDPLLELSFYDEMYQNVEALLGVFGYRSLEEYNNEATKVISTIKVAAEMLAKNTIISGATETTAGVLGIGSGVLAAAGLFLAPVSGGASLVLTSTGLALGLGSATAKGSSIGYQVISDRINSYKVIKITNSIMGGTMAIIHILEKYECAADVVEIELEGIGTWKMIQYVSAPLIWHFKTFIGVKRYTEIQRIRKILRVLNPRDIAMGLDKKLAFKAAGPEVKIPGKIRKVLPKKVPKTLIKGATSLSSTASKLNGILSAVSVGFGIWDMVSGIKKIREGSAISKSFLKLADDIAGAKRTILLAYDIEPDMSFTEDLIGRDSDDEGGSVE